MYAKHVEQYKRYSHAVPRYHVIAATYAPAKHSQGHQNCEQAEKEAEWPVWLHVRTFLPRVSGTLLTPL